MTVSPDRQPVVVSDLDEAIDAVRRSGLRLTSARRLVLEALLAAREPVSAEEIADGLGGRMTQSDVASVYRNLETLGGLGLVRHFHAGHGPGRYVLESRADREYLACESCGAVESVDPAALDGVRDAVRELAGFEARFSHFPIVGLCARCARERSAADIRQLPRVAAGMASRANDKGGSPDEQAVSDLRKEGRSGRQRRGPVRGDADRVLSRRAMPRIPPPPCRRTPRRPRRPATLRRPSRRSRSTSRRCRPPTSLGRAHHGGHVEGRVAVPGGAVGRAAPRHARASGQVAGAGAPSRLRFTDAGALLVPVRHLRRRRR